MTKVLTGTHISPLPAPTGFSLGGGALFFLGKVDDLFSRRPHRLKLLN